ncbi:MAG TPA: TFIIB-type zinc ribbon-containing protein [Candidatus Limnocylindria bacterium]|nr:TFIIB-type zinc ribbon-containing protein [Candidatus Limnocylindria bacterium]
MSTLTYKCPACGAPLAYDGRQNEMTCGNCGNTFDPKTIQAVNEIRREDEGFEDMSWRMEDRGFTEGDLSQTRTYSCSSCGAQLITEATTVATSCAFCGSPSVIPEQFSPGTRPQKLLPFIVGKAEAETMFRDYFKKRKLIPNLFYKGPLEIKEIRQLYAPFWLFGCLADARMTYRASTSMAHRSGNYLITTTRHFLLRRAGTLRFRDLPVDASQRLDNKITESIEPFRNDDAIDFIPQALSGAQANAADLRPEDCQERANERVRTSTDQAFRETTRGYGAVVPQSSSIQLRDASAVPVLCPMWIITTMKEGKLYTFAINGQTGRLTCDIPWSKAKFIGRLFGVGLGAAAAGLIAVFALARFGVL